MFLKLAGGRVRPVNQGEMTIATASNGELNVGVLTVVDVSFIERVRISVAVNII